MLLQSFQVGRSFSGNVATLSNEMSSNAESERLQNFLAEKEQPTLVKNGDITPFEVIANKVQNDTPKTVLEKLEISEKKKVYLLSQSASGIFVSNFTVFKL